MKREAQDITEESAKKSYRTNWWVKKNCSNAS